MSVEKRRIIRAIQKFLTPKTRYVRKLINGHSVILDTQDIWMRDNFLWYDVYEPETSRYISGNVRLNDIILDVGAHIGYHSLNFASKRKRSKYTRTDDRMFFSGKMYSFEPDPLNYRLLCKNTEDYFIAPLQVAVSDKEEETILYRSKNRTAWSSLLPKQNTIPYPVKTITIDSLNLSYVNFLKIDVEGAEIKVLNGAKETVERSPRIRIIVEWLPKNDGDFEGIMNFFEGWKCRPLDHNMLFWKEE